MQYLLWHDCRLSWLYFICVHTLTSSLSQSSIQCPDCTSDNCDILNQLVAIGQDCSSDRHYMALGCLVAGNITLIGNNHTVPMLHQLVHNDMTFVVFPLVWSVFSCIILRKLMFVTIQSWWIKVCHTSKNVSDRTQGITSKSKHIPPKCIQWLHKGIMMSVQSLSPCLHIGLCFMEMKSSPGCVWMIDDWWRVSRHITRIGNTSLLKQWSLPCV